MIYEPILPPFSKDDPPRVLSESAKNLIDFINRESPLGTLVLAIDPGGVHNGIAVGGCPPIDSIPTPCVYRTAELPPQETLYVVAQTAPRLRSLVVESFSLRADKAKEQVGSYMPTSKLIGAIEYIATITVEGTYYEGEPVRSVASFLFEQNPSIKTGSLANLRGRKIPSHAKTHGHGQHAVDAELHFYYFIFERLRLQAAKSSPPSGTLSRFDGSGPTPPKAPRKRSTDERRRY